MRRTKLNRGLHRGLLVGVLGGLLGLGSLACQSTHPRTDTGREAGVTGETCFNLRRVRSISPLHEMYALVQVNRDEYYLLTMERLCPGMPYATGFAISGAFTRVCSGSLAKLSYLHAGGRASCGILRVEQVASAEAARELVTERTPSRQR